MHRDGGSQSKLCSADRAILPGVGAFGDAMHIFATNSGLHEAVLNLCRFRQAVARHLLRDAAVIQRKRGAWHA